METNLRMKECFEKLGYHSDIPKSLVNPSTTFVWQQFINNVKPRNEVDSCRKNIIINRMQTKQLVKVPAQFSIREIQAYDQLKRTKEEIERVKARIQEKKNKEIFLRDSNKSNILVINSLKEKLEEKTMKIHALNLKSRSTESEIKQLDEMVHVKGLVQNPEEESLSSEAVSKHLMNLVTKIEQFNKKPKFANSHTTLYQQDISKIQQFSKTCYSTTKKYKSCKNVQRYCSYTNINSAKSLFGDSFKENQMNFGNEMEGNEMNLLDQSLGPLPQSCFNFKADDEFLTSVEPSYEPQVREESCGVDILKNITAFDNSMACPDSRSQCLEAKQRRDCFEEAYMNNEINEVAEEIFHRTNSKIWCSLCSLRERLLADIKPSLEHIKENVNFRTNENNEDDIARLTFIYIKNNLIYLKSKKQIKILIHSIQAKKAEVQRKLRECPGEDRLDALELQLEYIKLEGAIQFMHKELNDKKKSNGILTLNSVNAKINKAKEHVLMQIKEIEGYAASKENLKQKIKKCQSDTMLCVRKLNKFICDPVWADDLSENVHSNEIATFRDFPMDYNKHFCFTAKDVFYKDSLRNIIIDESTPTDTLYMITSLLEHPQNPPERIFSEILRKKKKLQVLNSLEFPKLMIETKNYILHDLQQQESYVEKFCENLISQTRSSKTKQILNSTSHMKRNMELWLEMPFRCHVSQERVVNGNTYKEYEDKFNYLKTISE